MDVCPNVWMIAFVLVASLFLAVSAAMDKSIPSMASPCVGSMDQMIVWKVLYFRKDPVRTFIICCRLESNQICECSHSHLKVHLLLCIGTPQGSHQCTQGYRTPSTVDRSEPSTIRRSRRSCGAYHAPTSSIHVRTWRGCSGCCSCHGPCLQQNSEGQTNHDWV